MKKNILILIFIFGVISICNSQLPVAPKDLNKSTVIESADYIITYSSIIVNNPEEPHKKVKDEVVLQIGKSVSKSFSNLLYQADSTATVLFKKGAKGIPIFQETIPPVVVYKNYPIGNNTIVYRTFLSGPTFEYKEPIPKFNWKLLPDKKHIHGYNCQKATTTYRGRIYEAWFTSQIPLKEGPYKFQGLPGLILEIMDTQEHYVFTCVGIKKSTNNTPILLWEWETQKTTKDKLNILLRRFHETPATVAESLGIKVSFRDNSGNEINKKPISYPYNPIELE